MINLIVDLIIIAIIVAGAIIGAKRGFIKSVLKTCAGIISLIIAYAFNKPLSAFLSEKYFSEPIQDKISAALDAHLGGALDAVTPDALVSAIPEALKNILNLVGYDIEKIASDAITAGSDSITRFCDSSASLIANTLATIISFTALLIGSFILLRILALLLDSIFRHIPGIKQLNSTLGLLFGLICTLINVWLFSSCAVYLLEAIRLSSPDFLSGFDREATVILKVLTAFNPISLFFN